MLPSWSTRNPRDLIFPLLRFLNHQSTSRMRREFCGHPLEYHPTQDCIEVRRQSTNRRCARRSFYPIESSARLDLIAVSLLAQARLHLAAPTYTSCQNLSQFHLQRQLPVENSRFVGNREVPLRVRSP